MEAKVVDDFINDFKKHFGELVVTKVRKHTCLGVNINIPEDKKVEINMKEQFLESIQAFGGNIEEKVTAPASIHLFIINKQAQQLDKEKSEIFHFVMAKLLYIMRRARPDLEKTISFLCWRVSKSGVYDWEKLKKILS